MLRNAVRAAVPEAVFEAANDRASLAARLGRADLVLVNRALDGDFDAPDGIELIRQLGRPPEAPRAGEAVAASAPPAMMLVSNYPEAQASAQAAGAWPGFGKSEVYADTTRDRLRRALAIAGH